MDTRYDLQRLTIDDIPELIALHHSVGWNSPPDFLTMQMKLFLTIGNLFGHRHQGRLITCAGVYAYGEPLASIGPVIVHPDYQRQGLGQELMTRCLQTCRAQETTVMLIATEAGQRLYRSLGFETVGYIRRMVNDARAHTYKADKYVRPLQKIHLPNIIEADRTAVGVDRSAFYEHQFANIACGYNIDTKKAHHNQTTGDEANIQAIDFQLYHTQPSTVAPHPFPSFGIATKRGDVLQIGPLVCSDTSDAIQIIHQLLTDGNGTLRIDVPAEQQSFLDALQHLGFTETLSSPLMTLGGTALPGRRAHLFGIADPALG